MLLVSVPDSCYANQEPFHDLRRQFATSAGVLQFNIPELRVGTLDSLMILDEELAKVDVMAEQSINKLQRQYDELNESEEGGAEADDELNRLLVKGENPKDYLQQFVWDEARYSHNRRLNELVKMIQQGIGKIDDDLKMLGQDYNETKQLLSGLLRKRSANLMVADLKDVLTKEACMKSVGQTPDQIFRETAFTQPVAVVVPAASAEEFKATYWKLCGEGVTLKDGSAFSPAVPGSALEILRDEDGYVLFRVSLLKGLSKPAAVDEDSEPVETKEGAEAEAEAAEKPAAKPAKDFLTLFSDACRMNRYAVKQFSLDDDEEEDEEGEDEGEQTLDSAIAKARAERDGQKQYLKRRCTPYFEDVYVAWIHIKAIRVFVESVLRYGVPPQYTAALIVPYHGKHMRKIRQTLASTYSSLDRQEASKLAVSEDVQRILGTTGSSTEYLPYISLGVSFLNE